MQVITMVYLLFGRLLAWIFSTAPPSWDQNFRAFSLFSSFSHLKL